MTGASLTNVLASVGLMLRRMLGAMKYAAEEQQLRRRRGRRDRCSYCIGTVTYSLGEGWTSVDGFYFGVSTLTTSSIAIRTSR